MSGVTDRRANPPVDRPRRAAYDLLRAVATRSAYANLVLPKLLRDRRIVGRDAAFATELGYGTLRAQGTLDAVLVRCADRDLSTVDPDVLDVLRLGAYQLLRMRVPAHAAVSATVDVAPRRAAGFVNAVLRKVSRSDYDGWVERIAPPYDADPLGHLAIRYAHPEWIVVAFRDALGGDLEQTAAALAADDAPAAVHLVARDDRDKIAAEVGGTPGPWSDLAVHLGGGDPGALEAIRDGRARVQDEGSQLVALAAGRVEVVGSDARWLDLCAGPGGKAALLGQLAEGRGARITALEPHPHRAELTRHACAGLPVDVIEGDGTSYEGRDFDRVLVDAPCSGLGALRRRPEARWRRRPTDLPELTALQRSLLTAGLGAARPGGIVTYATCSPHPAETRAVVGEVARKSGAELLDARALFPGVPDLGDGPTVQLWPHRHGTDAMFVATLRR
ncbi:MAG TPA: transcription antitermination factor NusB [Mycobacteriales bacterium]|nr:transcription antitermination factor NusB [Mycobacteriales bacterium]